MMNYSTKYTGTYVYICIGSHVHSPRSNVEGVVTGQVQENVWFGSLKMHHYRGTGPALYKPDRVEENYVPSIVSTERMVHIV